MIVQMYNNPGAVLGSSVGGGVATGGALAMTGWDALWLPLAAFALIAAGLAFMRAMPRRVVEDAG